MICEYYVLVSKTLCISFAIVSEALVMTSFKIACSTVFRVYGNDYSKT